MNEFRVMLDEKDFDVLTSGGFVTKTIEMGAVVDGKIQMTTLATITVGLRDIGYDLMLDMIQKKYSNLIKRQYEKED